MNMEATEECSPNSAEIQQQLQQISSSALFSRSERLTALLTHIVRQSLAGNADNLLGKNIARDVFQQQGASQVEDYSTVRVEVGRLRRRLREYYNTYGNNDPIRVTIAKGAYVASFEFVAEVLPAADQPKKQTSPLRRSDKRLVMAGALLVIFLSVGLVGYWWFELHGPSPRPTAGPPAVAVLPFVNLSIDPAEDRFALGATAGIVDALLSYDHLIIVSSASGARHGGKDPDIRRIGNELSVEYVLMGNVRNSTDHLWMNVQLIDAQRATVVWSEIFERPLTTRNIFNVHLEVAKKIGQILARPYGVIFADQASRSSVKQAPSLTAYDCVLRAYSYWRVVAPTEHLEVRDCLERAVEREPHYAAAWSALSFVYLDEVRERFNPRPDLYNALDHALAAAKRAVELAPNSASAHQALYVAYFIRNEIPAFMAAAEKAASLGRNSPEIISDIGARLTISGHSERGVALLDKAVAMNPVQPLLWHFAYTVDHYNHRRYEASLAMAHKIGAERYYMTHVMRAMNYGQLGMVEEGRKAVELTLKLKPDFAAVVRQDFRRRNIPEHLIIDIIEGLAKAGMEIPAI